MILDRFGKPLVVYERKAIGFTERTLPETESEPVSGLGGRGKLPEWSDDEGHAEPVAK